MTVDVNRYMNVITIASANIPPHRSSTSPDGNFVGGGVATAAGQPVDAPPGSTSRVGGPTQAGASTAATQDDGPGVIRPMVLAPSSGEAPSQRLALANSGGPPSPPQDLPPIAIYSGGSGSNQVTNNGQPVPGQYKANEPVPVGTIADLKVTSPVPNDPCYAITTVQWDGGTIFSSYFSSPAETQPTGGMKPVANVVSTANAYNFLVDGDVRNYTITVDVNYQNGASGESTLTFTSVRPSTTLTTTQVGTQSFTQTDTPGNVTVRLNPGIHMQATATTGANTAGKFMLMQLITATTQTYTDNTGQSWYVSNNRSVTSNGVFNDFNGPLIDDGTDPDTFGYQIFYDGGIYSSWTLRNNESIPVLAQPPATTPNPPEMVDTPLFSVPNTYWGLSDSESFSTYLMYQPTTNVNQGVWIALNEVDWSWSQSASNPNGTGWISPAPTPQPTPTSKVPSGWNVFPSWVNTGNAFDNLQLNPFTRGTGP